MENFYNESELIFAEKPKHGLFQDLEGQVFGKLTIIGFAGKTTKNQWFCKCICGRISKVHTGDIKSGHTTSCGCFNIERIREVTITHGHANKGRVSRTYMSWCAMRARCSNPNNNRYMDYGGRGITFCKRWCNFEDFLSDMGECPSGMSIDRIDVNGNYEPGNCRWATKAEQANNRRSNRIIEFNGKSQTVAQWARHLGFKKSTISARLDRGWSVEQALVL